MAREIAISSPSRLVSRARWRNSQWFGLRSVWEGLMPVAQIGHRDFSDRERPDWHIAAVSSVGNILEVPSCSITSAYDLAIEEVRWITTWYNGTLRQTAIYGFTPYAAYIPFLNNTTYWQAGIRPIVSFDAGNTVVVCGTNPLPSGLVGYLGSSSYSFSNVTYASNNNGIRWDPPLILPATMFFTIQIPEIQTHLTTNWRYREIG